MIVMVPVDSELYPTLGPQVCDFMEQNLVFGPGDLRGQPLVLTDERRFLIYRCYEVFPKGHARAGRRRFKRCGISLRKGLAKTELAALIAACELHPEAPVRCTGFTHGGEPIGGPVSDPYIPMVAYTEEQSDDLAYTALRVILELGLLKDDFDIGLDRIIRRKGDGKAQALSSSPNARDGARTTFSVCDETHRWTLQRLRDAHQVLLTNLAKRKMADPWNLDVTTAPEPGTGSIAEATMEYATAVQRGQARDASLFFFHRQASDHHDLKTADGLRAAVEEASGEEAALWSDIDAICGLWSDPGADKPYLERVYCNRLVQGSSQAFDVIQWAARATEVNPVKDGDLITLGFDGSMFHDATSIIGTHMTTGYQWKIGHWERPAGAQQWQVPATEVDEKVRDCFARYNVWRMYCDPPYWQSWVALWIGLYGKERVIEWFTNRRKQMAAALEGFDTAIKNGTLSHAGDKDVSRHIGNARRENLAGPPDEQGKALWLIRKDRPDSPHKIDAAMASVLSWEAHTDAIASGATTAKDPEYQMFFAGGRT